MHIEFEYSEEFEVKRIRNTLRALPWFRERGYRPFLPEGVTENMTNEEIGACVHAVFDRATYNERKTSLVSEFDRYRDAWTSGMKTLFPNAPESFRVFITRYGVDGSYNSPNIVVYSLRDTDGLVTIIHEIIHLCIEEDIQRFHISHWAKERIVDGILHLPHFSFLPLRPWQRNYRGTEMIVDPLLGEYFVSDRQKFFSEVGRLSPSGE